MARVTGKEFSSSPPLYNASGFRIMAGDDGGYLLAYVAPVSTAPNASRAVYAIPLGADGRADSGPRQISSPLKKDTGILIQSFDLTARDDGGYAIASRNQIAAENRFTVEIASVDAMGKGIAPTRIVHDAAKFQALTQSKVSITETGDRLRVDFSLAGPGALDRSILERDVAPNHASVAGRTLHPKAISQDGIAPEWLDSTTLTSGRTVTVAMDRRVVHGWLESPGGKILKDFRIDRDIPHAGGHAYNSPHSGEIAALDSGDFIVVWEDAISIGRDDHAGIVARRYDASGNAVGTHIAIDSGNSGIVDAPQVVALDSGGFLVAWNDYSDRFSDRGDYVVRAREFGPTGAAVGREFTIADDKPGGLDMARGENGRVLATWQETSDASAWDKLARSVLIADQARDFAGTIQGNGRANTLNGTGSADIMAGMGGNDRQSGKRGADDLRGGAGNDLLLGGAGKDILDGGAGRDTLRGGSGDDILVSGGRARDVLSGGAGEDIFIFHKTGKRTEAIITDFDVDKDHLAMNGFGLENEYFAPFRQTKAGLLFEVTPRTAPDNSYWILMEGVKRAELDDISFSFF